MDPQFVTLLVGLAGVSIVPLAGYGTKLLMKKADEAVAKSDLAKLGVQKSSMEICQKNVHTAIFATQQHFKKIPDATNEEKKAYGMELLATLNEEAERPCQKATMSALIDEGVVGQEQPGRGSPPAPILNVNLSSTPDASLSPTLDVSLPPMGMG